MMKLLGVSSTIFTPTLNGILVINAIHSLAILPIEITVFDDAVRTRGNNPLFHPLFETLFLVIFPRVPLMKRLQIPIDGETFLGISRHESAANNITELIC